MMRSALTTLRTLSKTVSPCVVSVNNKTLLFRHSPLLLYSSTVVPNINGNVNIEEYLKTHEISVSDPNAPAPALTFVDSGLPDYLLDSLNRKFSSPTPIQAQALPIALSGDNMVGIGQTGSGKTLAFLLPAFLHIQKERTRLGKEAGAGGGGPLVLVLAPTRELAQQINDVARQFRNVTKIRTVCCIGGEGRYVSYVIIGS